MHVACIEHATVLQANVCMDGRAIHMDVYRPIANIFKGGLYGCLMCISMDSEEYTGIFGHAPPGNFFLISCSEIVRPFGTETELQLLNG